MSKHLEALEAYFKTWDDLDIMCDPERTDLSRAALRQASPLAYAAYDKGCGVLSVAGLGSTIEQLQATIRAYLALLEALCEVSPSVPWAEVMNGPSRVFTAYERALAEKWRSPLETMTLREKIRAALVEALGDDASIQLEGLEDDRISGIVLSTRFAGMTGNERQDLIWVQLDSRLTVSERARVVFITTDTPEEFTAYRNA